MTIRCKKWDVWLARMKFENSAEIKARPVLVLDDSRVFALSLKMTSQGKYSDCYAVSRWKEAGLTKPTYVRLSKYVRLNNDDFIHKIGELHDEDIINLMRLLPS